MALLSMSGNAESTINDDPPQITFDTEQGIVVTEEVNITGTFIDESPPLNLVWKVYNGVEIVEYGDLISNLQPQSLNQSSRELWSFHLQLNLRFKLTVNQNVHESFFVSDEIAECTQRCVNTNIWRHQTMLVVF